jgi:hypothetical protein
MWGDSEDDMDCSGSLGFDNNEIGNGPLGLDILYPFDEQRQLDELFPSVQSHSPAPRVKTSNFNAATPAVAPRNQRLSLFGVVEKVLGLEKLWRGSCVLRFMLRVDGPSGTPQYFRVCAYDDDALALNRNIRRGTMLNLTGLVSLVPWGDDWADKQNPNSFVERDAVVIVSYKSTG